MRAQLAQNARV